ncbi:MAG TPA: OsmC family protein [Streptosporangiaceae bacterium]
MDDSPMPDIIVHHHYDDEFAVLIHGNLIYIDQPLIAGGGDAGPTPTELFVASYAACAAFSARRYLARHGLPAEGLEVAATYSMSDRPPARVTGIKVLIRPPTAIPEHRRGVLLAVVEGCEVHNSIMRTPQIHIDIDSAARAA